MKEIIFLSSPPNLSVSLLLKLEIDQFFEKVFFYMWTWLFEILYEGTVLNSKLNCYRSSDLNDLKIHVGIVQTDSFRLKKRTKWFWLRSSEKYQFENVVRVAKMVKKILTTRRNWKLKCYRSSDLNNLKFHMVEVQTYSFRLKKEQTNVFCFP